MMDSRSVMRTAASAMSILLKYSPHQPYLFSFQTVGLSDSEEVSNSVQPWGSSADYRYHYIVQSIFCGGRDLTFVGKFLLCTEYLKIGGSTTQLHCTPCARSLNPNFFRSSDFSVQTHFETSSIIIVNWSSTELTGDILCPMTIYPILAYLITKNTNCRIIDRRQKIPEPSRAWRPP